MTTVRIGRRLRWIDKVHVLEASQKRFKPNVCKCYDYWCGASCKIFLYYDDRTELYDVLGTYDASFLPIRDYIKENKEAFIENSNEVLKEIKSLEYMFPKEIANIFDNVNPKDEMLGLEFVLDRAYYLTNFKFELVDNKLIFHKDLSGVRRIKIKHNYSLDKDVYINDKLIISTTTVVKNDDGYTWTAHEFKYHAD